MNLSKSSFKYQCFILIFTTILLRIIPAFKAPPVGDMANSQEVAQIVLSGKNAYQETRLAPNPPPWLYHQATALYFSQKTSLPHPFLVKIPIIFTDCAIALLLFLLLGKTKLAFRAALLWALCPLSIFITAFQGQFDSMPLLTVLLALYFFPRRLTLSALMLGMGIALKEFPVLLLPFFCLKLKNHQQKAIFIFFSLAPVVALMAPFVYLSPSAVTANILNYSGFPDQGFMGLLRGIFWLGQGRAFAPLSILPHLISLTKFIYLALLALLVFHAAKHPSFSLKKYSLLCFLLFPLVFAGVSTQYLLWALPLLLLFSFKKALAYTFFSSLAALSYYAFFLPQLFLWILPKKFTTLAQTYSTNPTLLKVSDQGLSLTGLPLYIFLFYLFSISLFWIFSLKLTFSLLKN